MAVNKKKKVLSKQIILIIAAVVIFVPLITLYFVNNIEKELRENTREALSEMTLQQSALVNTRLEGQFYILKSLARHVSQSDISLESALISNAEYLRNTPYADEFSTLILANASGSAIDGSAQKLNIANTEPFAHSLNGEQYVCFAKTSEVSPQPRIFLSVPVTDESGETKGVILAGYSLEEFSAFLTSYSYSGTAHTQILDANASLIASNPSDSTDGILSEQALANASDIDRNTYAAVKDDLAAGASNTFYISYFAQGAYISYTPLGINDWSIMCVVGADAVRDKKSVINKYAFVLAGGLLFLGIVIFIIIYATNKQRILSEAVREYEPKLMQLSEKARRDSLTGLYNHEAARLAVDEYLKEHNDVTHAFFMIDIDDFKLVNDNFGHIEGDETLIAVSEQLRKIFRSDDIIARLGGDEFMVFMKNIYSQNFITAKATEVCESLQFVHTSEDAQLSVSTSVGIAVSVKGEETGFEELYKQADEALYRAKENGKSRFEFYDSSVFTTQKNERTPQQIKNTAIQYKALLDYLNVGIMLLEMGEKVKVLFISKGFYNVTGIAFLSNLDQSEQLFSLIDRSDRKRLRKELAKAAQSSEALNSEYRITDPSTYKTHYHSIKAVRIPYEGSSLPVMITAITDITDKKNMDSELELSGELLQTAFTQLNCNIYEVDIEKHVFHDRSATDGTYVYKGKTIPDVPEAFIREGNVNENSMEQIRRFYNNIYSGVPGGSCLVSLRNPDGEFVWKHLRYTSYKDETGKYTRAIVLSTLAGDVEAAVRRFEQEQIMYKTVGRYLFSSCIVNLSENKVLEHSYMYKDLFADEDSVSFTAMNKEISRNMFTQGDAYNFNATFSLSAMIDAYRSGKASVSCEYRMHQKSGRIVWMSKLADILVNPESGDIYAFIYTRKVTERKNWEDMLSMKPEREMITGLFTDQVAQLITNSVIQSKRDEESRARCAMYVVNIESVNTTGKIEGMASPTSLMSFAGMLLRMVLGSHFVMGFVDSTHIIIFTPNVTSEERLVLGSSKLKTSLLSALSAMLPESTVRVKVGICMALMEYATYKDLYAGGLKAIDKAYASNTEVELYKYTDIPPKNQSFSSDMALPEASAGAESKGEYPYTHLLVAMFGAVSHSSEPAKKVLGFVLRHYRGKKAYIAQRIDSDSVVCRMQQRYVMSSEKGKTERHATIELPFSEFMEYLYNIREPLSADKTRLIKDFPIFASGLRAGELNGVIISPIFTRKGLWGIIAVENPEEHTNDTTFISVAGNFTVSEITSSELADIRERFMYTDPLTGVMNRYSYVRDIKTIRQSSLNAAGVLSADINGLKYINKDYGDEAGDELIKKIASVITNTFGKTNVYRYSGDEFIAIALDITRETFEKQCRSVQDSFNKAVINSAAIGYAWSDYDIDINSIIVHAQEHRTITKTNMKATSTIETNVEKSESWTHRMEEMINKGYMKLYLQPKANVRTKALSGAEALCRIEHPEDGVITPDKFISRAENTGIIGKIDMYMLDKMLEWMEECRVKTGKVTPCSVNLSRVTAMSENLHDMIAGVCGKYPNIDRSLIEVEITESVGDIENATLAVISEKIRSLGFKLSLDDFGSKYSSLSVLSYMKFDVLKIDRSLVSNILTDDISRITVKNVITMCKEAGIECIAEGVETDSQYELLRELKCDSIQGYLINKPIPCEKFMQKYILDKAKLW